MGKRSNKDAGYALLEKQITKGDVDALLARWQFGKALLKERGDKLQLNWGRLDELSNALGRSRSELQNRMQFAEQYSTEAKVREAFEEHGSWHAICQKGLGKRSAGGWRDDTDTNAVHGAIDYLNAAARGFLKPFGPEDRCMDTIVNRPLDLDDGSGASLNGLYNGLLELRRKVDCAIEAVGKRLAGGGAYWSRGGGLIALLGTEEDQKERRRRKRAVLRREPVALVAASGK